MPILPPRLRELLNGLLGPSYGSCGGGDPAVWQRAAEERLRRRGDVPAPEEPPPPSSPDGVSGAS